MVLPGRAAPELLELHQSRTGVVEPTAVGSTTTPWLSVAIDEAGAPTLH